jgi:triacylglycerol esterase/lipase EstA (alpha/beta hydrolase family)
MGGIHYENRTDAQGLAVFNSTFGKYQIGAYDSDGIKLNEVAVDLFQNQNISLPCQLYGLTVTIRILDYFGQPISNVNVTLHREGVIPRSNRTQADGSAMFSGLTGSIGPSLQVVVYLLDQTQPFTEGTYSVVTSTTIEIRAIKYVMLAGFLVETSQLATVVIIVGTVLFILAIEVYRRRRLKPKKAES